MRKLNSRKWRGRRFMIGIIIPLLGWIILSYLALPLWWSKHESRHPALGAPQRLTVTTTGIPGDPVNLLIVGSRAQLKASMISAGWAPADPVTLRSSLEIAESSVFHRPYPTAPVSDLFLFGRKEDLAFEKPVGGDPRQRHHVRFWEAPEVDSSGRNAWWGAATFDRDIGFSHTTGQITHHISPDIDGERDGLIADLLRTGAIKASVPETGFQNREGRNGGGDIWRTDGNLETCELIDP